MTDRTPTPRHMEPVVRTITGDEDLVIRFLDNTHARGRLLSYRLPQRLTDGRVAIVVTLLRPSPWGRRVRRRLARIFTRRRLLIVVKILAWAAVLAAVAVAGWGVYLAVRWIAAHLITVTVLAVGGLLLAGAVTAANDTPRSTSGTGHTAGPGRSGCTGAHGPGCGHR